MGADVENVEEVYGDFLCAAAISAFLADIMEFHVYLFGVLCYKVMQESMDKLYSYLWSSSISVPSKPFT